MDRTRGIRYAVLGLLFRADDALHGWAIRRQLQKVLGGFWEVRVGEIYRTLDWLRNSGLAEQVESSVHFPMRKLFRITARGREKFNEFLREDVQNDPKALRQELSVRLLFGESKSISEQLVLVERQRQAYVRYLESVLLQRRLRPPKWAEELVRHLVIDGAEMQVRAQIAWLDRVATKLSHHLRDDEARVAARLSAAGSGTLAEP